MAHELKNHEDQIPYKFVTSNSNAFVSQLMYSIGIDHKDNLPDYLPGRTSVEGTIDKQKFGIDFTGTAEGPKFSGIFGAEHGKGKFEASTFGGTVPIGIDVLKVDSGFVPDDGLFHFGYNLFGTSGPT